MGNIVEITNLSKSYDDFPVFFDLNLQVKEHSATALLGPNGCGKTTLLKSMFGLTKVNAGSIQILNKITTLQGRVNKKNLIEVRKKIGFIPDKNLFFEHLTAFEYLKLISVLGEKNPQKQKNDNSEYINTILHEFRLDRWSNRLIYTFSTGTRQKLALAASIVHKPEILIMDEPFRGIDPEAHFKFLKYLKDFVKIGIPDFDIKTPGSILMCTHILDDVEKVCDNVIVMNEYGEVVLTGEVSKVKETLLGDKHFEELLFEILHEKEEIIDDHVLDYEEIHKELKDDF